ncbi:macro domain-containing protein [Vreelandella jeotgali]|uniref:macro domain-containing protein n=1 Tax=Vreelandella jeotgali TaxID=553386 RepID=UPI00034CD55E|nr:macro domain-containing protein [Halomonas jeotgali]
MPEGQAALTDAFNLPARYVIHTVGPVYNEREDQSALLADCYRNALRLAVEQGCATVAFPAISTGVYGYPFAEAARVVLAVMREALPAYPALEVTLCFFSEADADCFRRIAGS